VDELTEPLSPVRRAGAIDRCVARAICLPRGHWRVPCTDLTPDGIGLLVLRGQLIRCQGVEGGFCAELLGQGDLLRPWQGADGQSMLLHTSGWRVLESARVAVLDRLAATRLAGYPELTGSLVAKALERSRNLAVAMAIARHKRVEVRVHMLFWHLADRWGRVRLDGVVVPLRLSRWMLGDLVLAERESVSAALSSLARRGLLRYSGGEWLLWGDPPRELLQLEPNRFATNEA